MTSLASQNRIRRLLKKDQTEPIIMTPQQYRRGVYIAVAGAVLIVMGICFGIYSAVSMAHMREQNELARTATGNDAGKDEYASRKNG